MKHIFLTDRFFLVFGSIVAFFVGCFAFPVLFPVAQTLLFLGIAIAITEVFILFLLNTPVEAHRFIPKVLSLGDSSLIRIEVNNQSSLNLKIELIDELPLQFQVRNFSKVFSIKSNHKKQLTYDVRPTERGEYRFGDMNFFVTTSIGLIQRRIIVDSASVVPVYPSIIQMRKLEINAFSPTQQNLGIKRLRRLGHSYEFEHIKSYVKGDDYRSINWKASSRRGSLMVNQYEDERSQQIYCVIDKSRVMKMPFNQLSLMDHAINTSLVVANLALRKHDKAGLLTFSNKLGTIIKADRTSTQLNKILNALYKETLQPLEANHELLYFALRKFVQRRSLIFLFTNFESTYSLDRMLPILRRINKFHLLVIVFFKNTEVEQFTEQECETIEQIYQQTIARQSIAEKEQMIQQLRNHGIQAVLTRPDELSVNTVNKYLEMKARGMI